MKGRIYAVLSPGFIHSYPLFLKAGAFFCAFPEIQRVVFAGCCNHRIAKEVMQGRVRLLQRAKCLLREVL